MAINPVKTLTGLTTRAAGLAGIGLIVADSHIAARNEARMNGIKKKTDSIETRYFDTLTLNTQSAVKDKVQKRIFEFDLDTNVDKAFYQITGYAKGFTNMLLNNVVPLGLSLGAMIGPKGFFSKACGLGLAIYGAGALAQDVLRLGK